METYQNDVLVLKVGSSTISQTQADGTEQLDQSSMACIGKQLIKLQERGMGIVIVSSAAITAGMAQTGLTQRPNKDSHMPELQRLASIGWRRVLNAWDQALAGRNIGELLLTQHELGVTNERNELLRVTHALLRHGDIVVANENDAIAHQEIAFGDNDTLAATFAARLAKSRLFSGQVRLVMLSDINGVYRDRHDPSTLIKEIATIKDFEHLAGGAGSGKGSGGMITKFAAAEIATEAGIDTWIAHGRTENVILDALSTRAGTIFKASKEVM